MENYLFVLVDAMFHLAKHLGFVCFFRSSRLKDPRYGACPDITICLPKGKLATLETRGVRTLHSSRTVETLSAESRRML